MVTTTEDSPAMPDTLLGEDALVQLRVAHLNMLQGIISRMAGYSSTVKNFAVTIAAASLAFAFQEDTLAPLWIALGASLLFGGLDAYYLYKEKAFRAAYDRVASEPISKAGVLAIEPGPATYVEALSSVSVWLFYLPVVGVVSWLICKGVS